MKKLAVGLIAAMALGAGVAGQKLEDRADAIAQMGSAHDEIVQQVVPLEALPAYDTLEEAAARGAQRLYQCSHVYECGGVIALRPDGKYVLGPLKTSYSGDSVEISHKVPGIWKLVADYHSHPCNPESHADAYFSPEDLAGDLSLRITGIMLDECTGNIHEFTPGRDIPNNERVVEGVYLTQGRIVGHITVDGKSQEPDTGL